jgi:hypothetical protein
MRSESKVLTISFESVPAEKNKSSLIKKEAKKEGEKDSERGSF